MVQTTFAARLRPGPRRPLSRFELRCVACGYGIVVRIAPERCPMCGTSTWEHVTPVGPSLVSAGRLS
jgi:rubrerythrin